ncbi:MAG: hypothetical protein C0595_14015 [Marinilabiliales bacterium]|nr:MAG: hypothetical protein C0595_14015 [Marinilabiliales bacterium]
MFNKKKQLRFSEIVIISFVWILLVFAPIFFREDTNINARELLNILKTIIPLFIIFLINRLFFVPKMLFAKQNLKYILSVFALIAVISFGSFLYDRQDGPPPRQREFLNDQRPLPPRPNQFDENRLPPRPNSINAGKAMPPFINLLIFSFLLVGFDTGLMATFRLNKSEQQRAKLEVENAETQLAFLKSQVSPHFFMNTLNNIHSLIDINTEEAKDSIIRLSKLMRYLLYESENKLISIQKEMEFIKNYVDLMMLRFSEKVDIKLYIPNDLPDKSIPPLLFISYIENAFKHGISYQQTSFVKISFFFNDDKLVFETENSKFEQSKSDNERGIGIKNSKKRLDLLYDNDYSLTISENDEIYKLHLTIPI